MPGILAIISSDRSLLAKSDVARDSLLHFKWFESLPFSARRCRGNVIHIGKFNHPIVSQSSDSQVGAVLDGWLWEWDSSANSATEHCLGVYLQRGIDAIRDLNGQFNLLIWDNRSEEVFWVNDRYGLRPVYFAEHAGTLCFAPEAKAILEIGIIERNLNLKTVVNQLSFSRIWVGEDTLFEGVRALPPASIVRWKDGKVRFEHYWDYVYEPAEIDDEFLNDCVSTFRVTVESQVAQGVRIGATLTGGLDSRSVLAAVPADRRKNVQAYTWGAMKDSAEVALARETAHYLGVPWQLVPLQPSDFISRAAEGIRLSEGLDIFVQSYGLYAYQRVRDSCDQVLTGLALDFTLGGSYLDAPIVDKDATDEDGLAYCLRRASYFSDTEILALLGIPGARDWLTALRKEVSECYFEGDLRHPADRCDRFFLRQRVWRIMFQRQMWQRCFIEDLTPTFDNRFIDFLLRIPAKWRFGHRFYQKFLASLDVGCMEIPYQATMLPPSVPLDLWKKAAALENEREKLLREVYRSTHGRVHIPYTRYYTNFDEWLRMDPHWMAYSEDLLVGPKSILSSQYLNRDIVRTMLEQHRSAGQPAHGKLIQLMTLELFLREFFAY
jgi:asparagine synthase (glutamine-hydrolysing)